MTKEEWEAAPKRIDPDYAGSLSEKIGLDPELCPACGAHLSNSICLNACHLGVDGAAKFGNFMDTLTKLNKFLDN